MATVLTFWRMDRKSDVEICHVQIARKAMARQVPIPPHADIATLHYTGKSKGKPRYTLSVIWQSPRYIELDAR